MSAALDRLLHGLLLATDRPLAVAQIKQLIDEAVDEEEWPERADKAAIEASLGRIAAVLAPTGIEVAQVSQGYRLRTAADLAPMIRRLWPDRVQRLSRAALETLSIIAYRQPVTRAEIEEVRGVDCGGVVRSLLDRKLIRMVGRKDEPGRPMLYSTTTTFLETFSLADLSGLPTLRDMEAMQKEEAMRAQAQREARAASPSVDEVVARVTSGPQPVAAPEADEDADEDAPEADEADAGSTPEEA